MTAEPLPETPNPLLAEWERLCEPVGEPWRPYEYRSEREWYDHPDRRSIEYPNDRELRYELCNRYSFAIPSPRALRRIAALSPLVEVGAGTGYWAMLLAAEGADVLAYDLPADHEDAWANRFREQWYPSHHGDGAEVAAAHPDRTLLLCWPPMTTMAHDTLRAYADAGGQRLVYIGEGECGCCADDEFHALLEDSWGNDEDERPWRLVERLEIPQWPGNRDYCAIYERRAS